MWLGVRNPETREQKRTQNNERPAHSFLLTGWTGRRSRVRLDCVRILRPRPQEEKREEWKRGDANHRPLWKTMVWAANWRRVAAFFLPQASNIRSSPARHRNLRGSDSIPGRACAIHRSPAESARVQLRVSEK